MCEANAYLLKGSVEEMILDNVDQVDVDGDEVRMVNIFGEQKILKARMKSYMNEEKKILFEAIE
ncbi:MAG: CooT family nickel-binding protein [Deltaproteobacteria bacterium]|nr:CooT family nickel-binding protein [Deltaproteobacteria bacterium]